ncbi:MAG: hypothetical protein KDD62_05955 [Bdellovibrionales bacterium]|nr:hypothetical protein [Bdellovibrionales bacterium]
MPSFVTKDQIDAEDLNQFTMGANDPRATETPLSDKTVGARIDSGNRYHTAADSTGATLDELDYHGSRQ